MICPDFEVRQRKTRTGYGAEAYGRGGGGFGGFGFGGGPPGGHILDVYMITV